MVKRNLTKDEKHATMTGIKNLKLESVDLKEENDNLKILMTSARHMLENGLDADMYFKRKKLKHEMKMYEEKIVSNEETIRVNEQGVKISEQQVKYGVEIKEKKDDYEEEAEQKND